MTDPEVPVVFEDNENTVVTGNTVCPECLHINEPGNAYCVHCGTSLSDAPEITPPAITRSRTNWQVYGVETALVGRDVELARLLEGFQKVLDTGQLGVGMLVGPEGFGKSRLVDAFSQHINTEFGDALLISSRWREHGDAAYGVVDRLLRSRFYLPERLDEESARRQLMDGVRAIVKTSVAIEIAHRLGRMVNLTFPNSPYGIDEPAEEAVESSWRALGRLLRTDAQSNPLVIVLEDMQFAGSESSHLIPFLARVLHDVPIMCVITTTPEFLAERDDFIVSLDLSVDRVELRPLADDDIRGMVDQVLQRAGEIPEIVYERVCNNALGNPLVAEEILRLLIAEGAIEAVEDAEWVIDRDAVARANLPAGFSDVLQANVEHLAADEKRVLENAAVIGNDFWLGALSVIERSVADLPEQESHWGTDNPVDKALSETLSALVDKDLVQPRNNSRYPNDYAYTFKHSAVRRLVLDAIPALRQRTEHGLIAEWHELHRSHGVRIPDEVLAYHYEHAGNIERAADAYMAAAKQARMSFANRRALRFCAKALELLSDTELLGRINALHDVASIYDLMGNYHAAIPYLEEMLRCAWRLGSRSKGGAAYNKLGRAYRALGRNGMAMEHFELALELFRRANDRIGIASTLDDVGKVHWIRGDYGKAREHYIESLRLRRELGDLRNVALSENHLGALLISQGDFPNALKHFRKSLKLRKESGDQRGVAGTLNNLGVMLAERGDNDNALRLWEEGLQVAQKSGAIMLEGMLSNNLAEVYCTLGDLDKAEEYLGHAEQVCEECQEQRLLFDVLKNRGVLALRRQDTATARNQFGDAIALAERLDAPALKGVALRCMGDALGHSIVATVDPDSEDPSAESLYADSLALLRECGNEAEVGRSSLSLATFLIERGRLAEAREPLDNACEIFTRLGVKHLSERANDLALALED